MTPHFHFAVNRLGTGQRWNWIFGFCLCRYARVTLGCGFSAEVKLPYSKRRCEHGERYIEPRPKGRPEGTHIDDYVVEDHADHLLQTFKTQGDAIDWAKKNGHTPHVARVRHVNDKKKADHWRAV